MLAHGGQELLTNVNKGGRWVCQSHVHFSIWDIWARIRNFNKSKNVKIDKTNNEAMMNPKVNGHALKPLSYLLGVVKFFKVPFLQQLLTDLTPKVNDQPRIFPAALIGSCTVASNLKNAPNL